MGDANLTKLTASLEELSLKKQLPLRQSAQKNVLKYNHPLAKPVQLYNQNNVVLGPDGNPNPYATYNQPPSGSTFITPPYRIPKNPNLSSPQSSPSKQGGQNYVSPNNVGKSQQASKPNSNPYARPFSAKDIVSDIMTQNHQKMKKTLSSNNVSNSNHGNMGNGSQSNVSGKNVTNGPNFPVNSFMRPSSAVRKEVVRSSSLKESPTKDLNGYNKGLSSQAASTISENKGQNPRSASSMNTTRTLAEELAAAEAFKSKSTNAIMQKTVTSQGDQVITTRQGTNGVTVIQKVSAPPNFGTQINNIISKVTEPKTIDKQKNATIFNKPVSSIPKPGFTSSSSTASNSSNTSSTNVPSVRSMSPDSMTKVRNLNYTPTKPYDEVKDPTPKSMEEAVRTTTEPKKGILKTQATEISKGVTMETNLKKSPSTSSLTNVSSGPKQSISQIIVSQNRTNYYRKGSKSEIMLHEQRPPVVGAPSKSSRPSEKSATSHGVDGIDEDEDEESETGPGERFPGDGEASLEDDDDDAFNDDEEDDALDDLEEDFANSDGDGESDGYSITSSSLSRRSSSAHSRAKSATLRRPTSHSVSTVTHAEDVRPGTVRPATAVSQKNIRPALTKSLFPNIPPTVNFVPEGDKVEQLPWEIRKLLKWRMSPITPNIIKHTLARVGFRITKRNHDWLGCWGKHMKSQGFKSIREYQKLNHFPGSFQIGRKDRLWRNLSKMQVHVGKKEYGFFPQTFVLPNDMKLLKRAWEDGGNKQKWIIKPPASARGIGIKVIHKWNQIPRKRPVIVQRYLARPYLINDSKFDMRIYVYVSSYDPLRVYVFEDGLARFASCKYSSSMKNISNKFMHLTNYSINKKNNEYQSNGDDAVCQGHKWGLKALWNYMKRQGINTQAVWDSIKDLVVKTIICAESPINSLIKANCKSRYCVHELFGFDVLLDENLKPWILEVNISPSLHSNSQLDINIKGQMVKDLLNIAGFRIPDKSDVTHSNSIIPSASDFSTYIPPNDYCLDKRLYTQQLSPDERAKHAYYCQRHQDDQIIQTILDTLTPDDIRILTESIDEDSRKGGFQRVFPTPSTHKYMRFFDSARYYNLLLNQWVQRYNRMEQKGISLLESFCEDGVHLLNGTDNQMHQVCIHPVQHHIINIYENDTYFTYLRICQLLKLL
ncbi:hypothetical protein FSP39_013107 [Pinctada imbricata]|uniref:Tubulin polyglutamylase TTLL4 n=1 Tax=Pinctada imbricata TaxID=66713 RepID=A0AA88YR34_PINIB|nr:hypothetical protein FSP39_013107 [Pinctada imbricata]